MRIGFAKYDTLAQAEAVKPKLQAHHDNQSRPGPHIVDLIVKTYDDKYALTLLDGDEGFDLEGGTFVDSVEPPIIPE